jgi:hypothetical protein
VNPFYSDCDGLSLSRMCFKRIASLQLAGLLLPYSFSDTLDLSYKIAVLVLSFLYYKMRNGHSILIVVRSAPVYVSTRQNMIRYYFVFTGVKSLQGRSLNVWTFRQVHKCVDSGSIVISR